MGRTDVFRGQNVLITGGLGFIGSNLAQKLVEHGARVSIIDAMIPDQGGNLFNINGIEDDVQVTISDIRDEKVMAELVRDKDYIFNLASQLSHVDSMSDPFSDLDINCRGHLNLLEACRKYNSDVRIVYTGTRSQYGTPQYLPVDEKHPLNPRDINGIHKTAGEQYHLLYHDVYGIRSFSLRLTNTYGPRHQMKHSRQGFVAWFIRLAMDDEEIKIFGSGEQKRDLNYVSDVVSAILMSASKNRSYGEVFNLGSGLPVSLIDLVREILDLTGSGSYRLIPYPEESRKIEIGDYVADIVKIQRMIGWRPEVGLREGLKRTIDFYKKYRSHYWG